MAKSELLCPCGAGLFAQCCGLYMMQPMQTMQTKIAPTPEALMRSRYTAFVLGNEAYLRMSWHPDTCPSGPILEPVGNQGVKWLGLEVKSASQEGDSGTVEFVARYKEPGGQSAARRLHETSRFVRIAGHWYYVDGQHKEQRK